MKNNYLARRVKSLSGETTQTLDEHSGNVARIAAYLGQAFDSAKWTETAGLLHDIGKATAQWQEYLDRASAKPDDAIARVPHSFAGANYASAHYGPAGRILAYIISGHHAGLPDWTGSDIQTRGLTSRITEAIPGESSLYAEVQPIQQLSPPQYVLSEKAMHLWIRMMFSCLVDADRLDAEQAASPDHAALRDNYVPLEKLAEVFFAELSTKEKTASLTPVNAVRREVRQYCEDAAKRKPGLFSLTVPTGGGKTLSAMAFAFRHALLHGKKRIIYVIPYTSIIEQTATVLREILGKDNVLEHHSNIEPDKETDWSRLAEENWDAPVIVTTNVQFFESLYAARASRCRKLHSIVNSIVILDEAQMLPPKLLSPCVEIIKQLVDYYGTTIVFSTATQPTLPKLPAPEEIIPPSLGLYEKLWRVRYHLPKSNSEPAHWPELALKLQTHKQVLCIVNTRRDCYELFRAMPEGTIHLSALMCGKHRSKIISRIKTEVKEDKTLRVISTQLVEAGVDIDFPVVYRALAGLDSIAQAAGRCNREGKGKEPGKVHVFLTEKGCPPGLLRKGEDTTKELASMGMFNPDDPASFHKYFTHFYNSVNDTGTRTFYELLERDAGKGEFQFRTAESKFRLIDDYSQPVIVHYGDNEDKIAALRAAGPGRDIMRRLQRYMVNVPAWLAKKMVLDGRLEEIHPGVLVQGLLEYNEQTGLVLEGEIPPETFML